MYFRVAQSPVMFHVCRVHGELPEGVIPYPNGTLAFRRPLISSDAGTYHCVVKNDMGEASAVVKIILTGRWQRCRRWRAKREKHADILLISLLFPHAAGPIRENMLMIIVGATAGGLLILMAMVIIVITCHHKRKHKKLEKELTEKKYASMLFNYDKIR